MKEKARFGGRVSWRQRGGEKRREEREGGQEGRIEEDRGKESKRVVWRMKLSDRRGGMQERKNNRELTSYREQH